MAEEIAKVDELVVDPDIVEAKEWDEAADDLFPGLKRETENDEHTDTTTTTTVEPAPETTTTTTVDPAANETDEQKAERAKAAKVAEEKDEPIDTASIDARVAARAAAANVEAVKTDIRTKMFSDTPQVLQDADGDPIKTIEDVTKLNNPLTGKAFTTDEAAAWLLSAQQQFNQNLASMEKQIDQITEVNLDLKDQADMVTYEYGELLKAMPDLQKELWTEYEKTMVTDTKTGIITKAPVSLTNFYKLALKPYVDLAAKLEADNTVATTEAEKVAADKVKSDAEAEKVRKRTARQDRSDIYGGGKVDTMSDEEKEWGAAAEAVFGNQLKGRK